MPAIEIKPSLYWIGVNDRTTDLFEGIWPITHEGISYNSYLITDEKKALVDLTKVTKEDSFLGQVYGLMDPADLDYIVINHMEPDHTGAINLMRRLAPRAEFLCSAKAKPMLENYFGISERVRVVKDGEQISLGGRSLQFHTIPFVHWPETMATYVMEQRVLLSGDAFGGYGALRGAIFDDQYADLGYYKREALRYYVNIISKFSGPVLRAIDKLSALEVDLLGPSHGLIWRGNPGEIISLYKQWAQYATTPGDLGVTLVYGSMYGNTEAMMNAVAEGISQAGLPVDVYDAARTHVSYILPSLWTRRGVMIGAPTYEASLFPPVAEVLRMAGAKRMLNKKVALFGSYGWSGGAQRECEQIVESLKWEWVDVMQFQGAPTSESLRQGEAFGRRFAEALKV